MNYPDITRRRFLSIAAATGAVLAFRPLPITTSAARAESSPSRVKVLVEDVGLGIDDLLPALGPAFTVSPAGITLAAGRPAARFVSPVIQADIPFTHVGLHWSATMPPASELSFEVRTASAGAGWTPWVSLLVEATGRDTPSGETFAALTDAPRHDRLQFRASFAGPATLSPVLTGVTATLINSKDGPALDQDALTVSATIALPDPATAGRVTYRREDWGANETLRNGPDGAELWPPMYVPVTKLVIHHTATSNGYQTTDDAKAEVRAIHAYHARTLGWGDIGYSAIVDKFGDSYEGRYGRTLSTGREVLSEDVVAGHALSHNYGSAGIASLGTHTSKGEGGRPGDPVTQAAFDKLVELLVWYGNQRGIDSLGSGDFLRSDDTWNRALAHVPGHRDCNATICPGGQLYDLLPSLRAQATTLLGRPGSPDLTATVDHAVLADGATVGFNWVPSTAEYYLEAWRKVTPQSEDIVYLSGYDSDRLPSTFADDLDGVATLGEVFAVFKNVGTMEPGHYSLHLRSFDGASFEAVRTVLVLPDGASNSAPAVSIDAPADSAMFLTGELIEFRGVANDAEDGDLTGQLVWTSDLDGEIGTGDTFATTLSVGPHLVTAAVSDSGGLLGTDSVTVLVAETPTGFVLEVRGYKVKGLQFVDLSWSGTTASNIEVRRDGLLLATVSNSGSHTDEIGIRGAGIYTYIVCAAGTAICSNEVTVVF